MKKLLVNFLRSTASMSIVVGPAGLLVLGADLMTAVFLGLFVAIVLNIFACLARGE